MKNEHVKSTEKAPAWFYPVAVIALWFVMTAVLALVALSFVAVIKLIEWVL